MPTDAVKRQIYGFRRREPVEWKDGEREALIAKALADGKAKQIPRGASGYEKPEEPHFNVWKKSS